jgi:hypothetical protein
MITHLESNKTMSEDVEQDAGEVMKWTGLVEAFSNPDHHIIINGVDEIASYRIWAQSHLDLSRALLAGTLQREAMAKR